ELGPAGITVNAVAPGFFATESNAADVADPGLAAWLRRRTALGRPAGDRRRGRLPRLAGRRLRDRAGARRGRRVPGPFLSGRGRAPSGRGACLWRRPEVG